MMPKYTFTARILPALTAIALFFLVGNNEAAAAKLADGTYEVEYTVKKPDNDSVSIANDYFEKPARVEVRNGEAVVYFRTNHNKWITSLKYPAGADAVELQAVEANEAEDAKVFRLPHANVLEPAVLVVNVKIDELGYDQEYAIRLVFKTEQLPLQEEPATDAKPVESAVGEAVPGAATQGNAQDKPSAAGSGQQNPPEQQEQTQPQVSPSAAAPEQRDDPVTIEPEQQDQQDQQDRQDQENSGEAAEASPERSAEHTAPAATSNDAAQNDSQGQAAAALPAGGTEAEPSGNGAWPALMTAIAAVCVVAVGGGWAYRRRRNKTQ